MKSRAFWWIWGVITHGLFFWTAWTMFWFLKDTTVSSSPGSYALDLLLSAQFGIVHSFLLHPRTRKPLERFIPSAAYGCFFAFVTCVSLLTMCTAWQRTPIVMWEQTGPTALVLEAAYCLSWVMMIYSIGLTGFGYQTGFTTWWPYVRGLPIPRREFKPRSLFLLVRHPVYLSMLGLVWFTPLMTADRLLLAGVWTVYIFIGSWLKDQRLVFYIGEPYRRYQADVPGYPGMPFGPLARVRPAENVEAVKA